MMKKKDVIVAVLATFCLAVTLFCLMPVRSAQPYDPWADYNDDGKINMVDIANVASQFATSGDPTKNVNVTNWPEQQYRTIVFADNASIAFPVQDVRLGSVDVAGFRHVSVFIYHYTDGNVDLRLYSKCWGIQYSVYTAVSMHTLGTWYTAGLLAYEVNSPIIDLTLHSYAATHIYLTLVLYCYN